MKTKNGKVEGAECTPFVLPKRWTYETLLDCVRNYVRRVSNNQLLDISTLYYKKNRSKTVVKMTGDGDVKSLLDQYPMKRVSGNKLVATMYLAVDLEGKTPIFLVIAFKRQIEFPEYKLEIVEVQSFHGLLK